MCLRHSRNSNQLEMLCSESATMGFRRVNIHFDKLYVVEPTIAKVFWIGRVCLGVGPVVTVANVSASDSGC